jgi:hypothetical protein
MGGLATRKLRPAGLEGRFGECLSTANTSQVGGTGPATMPTCPLGRSRTPGKSEDWSMNPQDIELARAPT